MTTSLSTSDDDHEQQQQQQQQQQSSNDDETITNEDEDPNTTSSASRNNPMYDKIRSGNWNGSIPIVVTLASTSLSSTTIPKPIHVLVARNTFLHIGLESAVRRLYQYAPPTFTFFGSGVRVVEEPDNDDNHDHDDKNDSHKQQSENNDNDNNATNNDNDRVVTNEKSGDKSSSSSTTTTKVATNDTNIISKPKKDEPYPICWFEDERTGRPLRWQYFVGVLFDSSTRRRQQQQQQQQHDNNHPNNDFPLPWRIKLHFNSYPSQHLLELDSTSGVLTTIERTYKNSLKQSLVMTYGNNKVALNMTKQSHEYVWKSILTQDYDLFKPVLVNEIQPNDTSTISILPVRLCVDPTQPMIQKRCVNTTGKTLGLLLHEWAPQYFEKSNTTEVGNDDGRTIIRPTGVSSWRVAGVTPPLSTSLVDLWKTLSYPDNFLYVSVIVGSSSDTTTKSTTTTTAAKTLH
jgi:autophagy-related protein 5